MLLRVVRKVFEVFFFSVLRIVVVVLTVLRIVVDFVVVTTVVVIGTALFDDFLKQRLANCKSDKKKNNENIPVIFRSVFTDKISFIYQIFFFVSMKILQLL